MRQLTVIVGLVVLCLLAVPQAQSVQQHYASASVTSASQSVSWDFLAPHLVLVNDGSKTAYWTLASTTATTADAALKAGESIAFSFRSTAVRQVALVTGGSDTTTVRVIALCDDSSSPCGAP